MSEEIENVEESTESNNELVEVKETANADELKPWGMDFNMFLMLIHLSPLANIIFPPAGFIVPIVMWVQFKEENEKIDLHGKEVTNWLISTGIYLFISFILCFVFIGFLLLPLVGLFSLIFSIIGAMKANNGEDYKYPLTIRFIK